MRLSRGFFIEGDGDHRDLHVLTHSFPTRRASDLMAGLISVMPLTMAAATNTHSFWELLRIARWHVEGSAYDRALAMIVEAHAALPMAAFWGDRKSTRLNSSH